MPCWESAIRITSSRIRFLALSWEGFVIENLLIVSPEGTEGFHYRTSGGAEIDLLLNFLNGEQWAVEVKRSLTPRVERGFHSACADLKPARRFVVYPGTEIFPLGDGVKAIPLPALAGLLDRQKS